jgi:NAD(P)-dependent dehydrogenase (short-subunit alcohol dehydrogenase family)
VSVIADTTRPAEITAMVTATLAAYGRLDCAFNNAGSQVGAGGKLTAEWPEEASDQIIQVNLKASGSA